MNKIKFKKCVVKPVLPPEFNDNFIKIGSSNGSYYATNRHRDIHVKFITSLCLRRGFESTIFIFHYGNNCVRIKNYFLQNKKTRAQKCGLNIDSQITNFYQSNFFHKNVNSSNTKQMNQIKC